MSSTNFILFFIYLEETKEDREKEIDPKLLFPLKEWLLSWLPGHSFEWDFVAEEEARLKAMEEEESKPIHQDVRERQLIDTKLSIVQKIECAMLPFTTNCPTVQKPSLDGKR